MKTIKSAIHFFLLGIVKLLSLTIISFDLGVKFKNKFAEDKTHFKIRGKRMLINDYIREQAARLPKMNDDKGNEVNHVQDMKKAFRLKGIKGILIYIRQVNRINRAAKYPNPVIRLFHLLKEEYL